MIEAVFLYRAASRPTQHLWMPAGTEPFSSWRVDGYSTGFQRPSIGFTAVMGDVVLIWRQLETRHFKECRYVGKLKK